VSTILGIEVVLRSFFVSIWKEKVLFIINYSVILVEILILNNSHESVKILDDIQIHVTLYRQCKQQIATVSRLHRILISRIGPVGKSIQFFNCIPIQFCFKESVVIRFWHRNNICFLLYSKIFNQLSFLCCNPLWKSL